MLLVGCLVLLASAHGILLVGLGGTSWSAALVQQEILQGVWFRRIGGF